MSAPHIIPLEARFTVAPAELLNVTGNNARLPIDNDGYVPLRVFGQEFDRAITAFTWLGDNAVRMTMHDRNTREGFRFGFKTPLKERTVLGELWQEGSKDTVLSQQVDGITLTPSDSDAYGWDAAFDAAAPPSGYDKKLFSYGLLLFVDHAIPRLWATQRQTPPTTTQP